jgi:hypothetical protein
MSTDDTSTPRDEETSQVAISAGVEAANSKECPGVDTQELGPIPAPERSSREVDFARRALVQAGWAVPVVLAVDVVPREAKAQLYHDDFAHDDASEHEDSVMGHDDTPHGDSIDFAHVDSASHIDTPHEDFIGSQ